MRVLGLLLCCCVCVPLHAQTGGFAVNPDERLKQDWEQRFRAADKDESRSLDRAEATAGLPRILSHNFDRIDLDRDARITPEELWAMHEREVAERQRRRAARVGPPRGPR